MGYSFVCCNRQKTLRQACIVAGCVACDEYDIIPYKLEKHLTINEITNKINTVMQKACSEMPADSQVKANPQVTKITDMNENTMTDDTVVGIHPIVIHCAMNWS